MTTRRAVYAHVAAALVVVVGLAVSTVSASVIYEDVYYWSPDGGGGINVLRNPAVAPIDAYVKIQETVYDDAQGRQQLDLLMNTIGAIHGDAIPAQAFDLYVYSITNLSYAPTPPVSTTGHGVAGYLIDVDSVPLLGQWAPNDANDAWTAGGTATTATWDIDDNLNTVLGDGWGIMQTQTFAGFMLAVPKGTNHRLDVDASVWSWTGEGGQAFGQISGTVSGPAPPVPEPATVGLLALGLTAIFARRTKRR